MKRILLTILLLAMPGFAEIYQTIDEKGNYAFSDKPKTDAKIVQLPEDPVLTRQKNTDDLLSQIRTLTLEIKSLERRLSHFSLNDYEEAVLTLKLEKMRKQLHDLKDKTNASLDSDFVPYNDIERYKLYVAQKNIHQLQTALAMAKKNHEPTQYFQKRLQQEQAALRGIEAKLKQ